MILTHMVMFSFFNGAGGTVSAPPPSMLCLLGVG